jgi:glycerol kinase
MSHILAIDQGTTSSRAIVFDREMRVKATAQQEFAQHFPASGWVEHDPEDIWATVTATVRGAIDRAGLTAADISAIGITNQRETTLVWDKTTGEAIHRAIVWQDRRTAELCSRLKAVGHEPMITRKTGLLLDPYFSGTKLKWVLENVPGAGPRRKGRTPVRHRRQLPHLAAHRGPRSRHRRHQCRAHAAVQHPREPLGRRDPRILDIPALMLPDVRDCAADFGTTRADLFGRAIPILGVAGDQQAATIGQACFAPGMMKSTYGTGCFALLNTGDTLVESRSRLLGTIAYRLNGKTTYALEGSIFIAGAVVQWLRDGLKIIREAKETQPLAAIRRPRSGRRAGPGLHRPRRALLERRLSRCRLWPDPQLRPGRNGQGGARKRRLPDPRSS